MEKHEKYARYLAFAGAVPFILCAASLALKVLEWPWLGQVQTILLHYGLVITAFMAGSHWGQHLAMASACGTRLAVLSNLNAVVLWWLSIILSFNLAMLAMALILLNLWWVDQKLYQGGVISKTYYQTRSWVTALVVLSLLLSALT